MVLAQDAMQLFYWAMASGFVAYILVYMLKLFIGGRW